VSNIYKLLMQLYFFLKKAQITRRQLKNRASVKRQCVPVRAMKSD